MVATWGCAGNEWSGTETRLFTAQAAQPLFFSLSLLPPLSLLLSSHILPTNVLCRLSPLLILIRGLYLFSIHMFYIKPANEM